MRRILILDEDHSVREHLVEMLRRTVGTEIVLASDASDLVARVAGEPFAGVFADAALLGAQAQAVMTAIRSAPARPVVILASNDDPEVLDPDLVSLIVRKPYDVPMVTGILLTAVFEMPPSAPGDPAQRRDFDA